MEKILPYSRDQITQDTGYYCGPATCQTIIQACTGQWISESTLAAQMGTTINGTDYIGLLANALNSQIGGGWRTVTLSNDPPTSEQVETLWNHIVGSIDGGVGVAANIVVPPSNYPKASYKSTDSLRYGGGTVYHYLAVMGYATDDSGKRHVWLADSGFAPYGSWVTLEQFATMIPPKGYAYASEWLKTGSTSTPTPALAPPVPVATIFGVDVSEHQNGMSLTQAAREGIQFAIVRTTDGTYRDSCYQSHIRDAENGGLVTAAYHYLRNPSEGTTVAQQVQASLSVMGDLKRPIWLDCETDAGLSAAHIREFKQRFEAAGVRVIGAYSYVPWWEGRIVGGEPDSHEFGAFWVAAYGQNRAGSPAAIYPGDNDAQWNYPLGNQKPALWQFGSNASVAGYSVDINAYRGSVESLRTLFYGGNAAPSEEDELANQTGTYILDQLVGPEKKADGTPEFSGWPQLGGKTVVDFLVALDKKVDAIAAAQKENK